VRIRRAQLARTPDRTWRRTAVDARILRRFGPHSWQNLAPGWFSFWQQLHCILVDTLILGVLRMVAAAYVSLAPRQLDGQVRGCRCEASDLSALDSLRGRGLGGLALFQ
jgi:hypothetical protein